MEPILTIDNLNSFGGNMLRQGDKSQLKYRLRDVGNKNLSISSKPCQVKMYGRNYTTVVYETSTTVSSDNTVTFTINKVLPKGTFYLEFTVGDYIFPTDHREFFEITPSGKGTEANIIEIVGVDAVVRKAVDLINQDPNLIIDEDKLVTDIISNTGIGNINEYYKAFNDLKPKAEQSITKSAEALTKSQNALNVANGIDAKATNALSLSESADTLSKSVQEQFNQVIIDGDSSVEAAQARVDASGQTNPTLKARLDKEHNEVTAQLAQNKQEFKTKRAHINALSDDKKAPFEIHNQAGQDGADVSSEVTHHYTDATAKVIDNVGNGTILMLSNSQNTVMRPDKGVDFVGNGNVLKYRKFNNATKLYDEVLNVDAKGNIERKAVDEPFNIIVRKPNNGYAAFSIDSAVAQTIPVNFRNGGSFLTLQDEASFTKSAIVSPANKTTGLELRSEAGSIYLQAPNGTVQIRFNSQLYQAQLVMAGTTAQRPSTNLSNGRFYFDTTIGKPIWRLSTSSTGWVDAMGNPA